MKKIYQSPSIEVIKTHTDGVLCKTSGKVDPDSIVVEEEETMVKSNNYNINPVQWEDWQ